MKKKEIAIDFKDLCVEIIKKIWIILIVMVGAAVITAGVKYWNDMKVFSSTHVEEETNVEIQLSEEEKKAVATYIEKYREYEALEEYLSNSIILDFNPYKVYRMDLQYVVENNDRDANILTNAYYKYISTGAIATDIAKNSNTYVPIALQEVINVDNSTFEDVNILNVCIWAKDEEQLDELLKLFETQVAAFSQTVNKTIGEHKLVCHVSHKTQTTLESVKALRSEKINASSSLLNEIIAMEAKLTVEQLRAVSEELESKQPDEDVSTNNSIHPVKPTISKSYAVIGALAGALLSVFVICVVYYFSSAIKTKEEIEKLYDVKLIGSVSTKNLHLFEKIANKIVYPKNRNKENESPEYLKVKLYEFCKNNDYIDIVLVGEQDILENSIIQEISEELYKKQINVHQIGNVLDDENALKELNVDTNVIIVSRLKKTEYTCIDAQINLCKLLNVNLLGYLSFNI